MGDAGSIRKNVMERGNSDVVVGVALYAIAAECASNQYYVRSDQKSDGDGKRRAKRISEPDSSNRGDLINPFGRDVSPLPPLSRLTSYFPSLITLANHPLIVVYAERIIPSMIYLSLTNICFTYMRPLLFLLLSRTNSFGSPAFAFSAVPMGDE